MLKVIARKSPRAKVVATDRIAKAKVQRTTWTRGPCRLGSVKARWKFSSPTFTFHPVFRLVPSGATKEPRPLSEYTTPVWVSVKVSAAASYFSLGVYT